MKKIKIILHPILVIITLVLLVFQTSCKQEEDPSPEPEIIIADNAKVIDGINWQNSFVSMDSATYTYTFNSNISHLDLKVGDILVSAVGEGLLRRITGITVVGEKIEIQTGQAKLADVIEKGQVRIDTQLTISGIKSIKYNYGGIVLNLSNLKQTGDACFQWDINTVLYDADGNLNTTADQVRLEGEFDCDWNLMVLMDFGLNQGLNEVKCGFGSSKNLDLRWVAGMEYNLSRDVDLLEINFNPIVVMVGPLPVVFSPQFNIKAGVEGYSNASMTASLVQSMTVDAGIHYLKDQGWSSYKTFDRSFSYNSPQINVNAGSEAYLNPDLTIKIYGIAGPYANHRLYGRLNADLLENPWWELYGGLNIAVGAKASVQTIIGDNITEFNAYDLINEEILVAQATSTPDTLPVAAFTGSPTSGTAPLTVNFTDQSANSPTSWQWNFGDGGTSTQQNPSHTYELPGTYTVELSVANIYGSDTEIRNGFIAVSTGSGTGDPCPGIPTFIYQEKTYNTVQIGSQCWMRENLNYAIGNSWCYNNDTANCSTYGRMYDWATIMNGEHTSSEVPSGVQGICPPGWHIPSDAEWDIIVNYLGGSSVAGGKMKEAGFAHWKSPNTDATNESGFTALPGGYRSSSLGFIYLGEISWMWSCTNYNLYYAWSRTIDNNAGDVIRFGSGKDYGYSLRCIKD